TRGRSAAGALASYRNTGKNREAPPASSYSAPVAVILHPSPDAAPRGLPMRLVLVPDWRSSSAACESSSTTFAGQRPPGALLICPLRPEPAPKRVTPSAFTP